MASVNMSSTPVPKEHVRGCGASRKSELKGERKAQHKYVKKERRNPVPHLPWEGPGGDYKPRKVEELFPEGRN